jgi:hypothetical protein
MQFSMTNDSISVGSWIVLGIAGFLLVFAIFVAVIGYRDRQLPIDLRDKDLDRKLERIGLPIKILGAATIVMVGVMNIMGWKL